MKVTVTLSIDEGSDEPRMIDVTPAWTGEPAARGLPVPDETLTPWSRIRERDPDAPATLAVRQ